VSAVDEGTLESLVVIAAAATAAPLIVSRIRRWLAIPCVVFELVLGIVVGPDVLGLARDGDGVALLAELGLAMLFFMAGYEIEFGRIKGRPLNAAAISWLASVAIALGVGLLVSLLIDGPSGWLVIGLALSTTALGTILPIARDAGVLGTPFGTRVLAVGAVGEFGPIIAIALLLSGDEPRRVIAVLLAFVVVAVGAAWLAMRPRPHWLRTLLTATLGTSVQLAIRMCLLVIIGMVTLAHLFGLDILLGAFTSGIVVRLAIATVSQEESEIVMGKLDAIAFGWLVPFYFVVSGIRFDLAALLASPAALVMLVVFVPAFLLTRAVPTAIAYRHLPEKQPRALALLAATALPLVVAITDTGVDDKAISTTTASALVGAAVVSVLLFPMLATRMLATSSAPGALVPPQAPAPDQARHESDHQTGKG
jgi:Kef-type K+ transport system membrane component KefB